MLIRPPAVIDDIRPPVVIDDILANEIEMASKQREVSLVQQVSGPESGTEGTVSDVDGGGIAASGGDASIEAYYGERFVDQLLLERHERRDLTLAPESPRYRYERRDLTLRGTRVSALGPYPGTHVPSSRSMRASFRISTGSLHIDMALRGGIASREVTEVLLDDMGGRRLMSTKSCWQSFVSELCVMSQLSYEQAGGEGRMLYIDTKVGSRT